MLMLLTRIIVTIYFTGAFLHYPVDDNGYYTVYDDGPYPYDKYIGDWYFSSPLYGGRNKVCVSKS